MLYVNMFSGLVVFFGNVLLIFFMINFGFGIVDIKNIKIKMVNKKIFVIKLKVWLLKWKFFGIVFFF